MLKSLKLKNVCVDFETNSGNFGCETGLDGSIKRRSPVEHDVGDGWHHKFEIFEKKFEIRRGEKHYKPDEIQNG